MCLYMKKLFLKKIEFYLDFCGGAAGFSFLTFLEGKKAVFKGKNGRKWFFGHNFLSRSPNELMFSLLVFTPSFI